MGGAAGNFGGTQGNPIPQGVSGTSFSGPDPRFQRAQVAQPAPIAPAPQIANTPTVYQPNFAASGAATDYTLSPLQAQSSFMRNPTEAAPASLQQGIYNPYSVNSYMNPYGMYGGFNPYGGGIMGLLGGYGMGGMGGMGGYGMGGYGPYRFY